ncbi:BTAD domain-containing putative transcriptional regulator [Nocardia sp. NPDC050793]|uniref:AfsR/SARP family transcriptional regulator n=1 Tax=Nocardia sp. NPDC050793 TaxID=3155159 RepID=UPI00340CF317
MRFRVLGAVEITVNGVALTGAAPRHRAVLGYLLLHAGQVLSAERITDAMWGAHPPDTARSQIHAAITAIRRVLRQAGAAELLQTRGAAGYVLSPGAGQLDLTEFTDSVALGQADVAMDPREAVRTLRAALALWQGEAFADVSADYVTSARIRLHEKRLGAMERLFELELALGRHEEILDELVANAAAEPLRERLHAHLVLALYRSGRQADALGAARAFRVALADGQGLDPGRTFVALEQAVLQDDPGLSLPPMLPVTPAESRAAGIPAEPVGADIRRPVDVSPHGGNTIELHRAETPSLGSHRPDFLPYDIPDFAGRADELDQLIGRGPGDGPLVNIVVLDGMAGIGKTTLAIHTAHRLGDRCPDGRLFIDLQGRTPGGHPVEPGAALEILLRQLGVPAERIPMPDAERGALWRAELAARAVVVVLDNAVDADQIRPLLPGASPSLLLITSRRRLVDLDGARSISLDPLPAGDAVVLFGRIVGARADAEPVAVLDVLQLCGFLPLAVRIAAARLHHRPRWSVEYLADRLRDERRRLAELATADRGVAAAFTLSYEQLTPAKQRMFRLLGLHPGRDVEPHAAAALADISVYEAEDHLEDLLDAHMLAQHEAGRYTFHDLLREFAHGTATIAEDTDARRAATARLFEHYLYHARAAVDLLFPYGADQRPELPQPARAITGFPDETAAARWLDAERENLVAAAATAARCTWPMRVSDVATTLRPYLDANSRHSDAVILHGAALQASRRVGDRTGEARALTDLGWTAWRRGDYGDAEALSRQAAELCRATGIAYEEARAYNTLGNVAARRRDFASARELFGRALELTHAAGNRVGEAHVLGNLGDVLDHCGEPEAAADHLSMALALHRELGNRRGEALVLDHIGLLHRRDGRTGPAFDHHRRAAELYAELGDHHDRAAAINGLGETARAAGDPLRALTEHTAALRLAEEHGNRSEQARAEEGLARTHHALGDTVRARHHARRALAGWRALHVPDAEDVREFLDGLD